MYSRSTGEVNSNRVTSALLRKRTRLPTHAHEVGALTFEVTDNFGSNVVLPCGAYGPCSDKCTCCHTETEVADQTSYLTQSQYTATGPASPSADPRTPGAWSGSQWSTSYNVAGTAGPAERTTRRSGVEPRPAAIGADVTPLGERGG